jgi:hypothetical protein
MMTIKRFKSLTDSYGGDFRRWPEEARAEAQRLIESSPQARVLLKEASRLDEAIDSAHSARDEALKSINGEVAGFKRLRTRIMSQIPSARQTSRRGWRLGWMRSDLFGGGGASPLRRLGVASGCVAAVVMGLLIGWGHDSKPPRQIDLIAVLEGASLRAVTSEGTSYE